MNTTDLDLLQQYARQGSEDAFAALVSRYVNLVYSAALRRLQSACLAEEVAQSVFTDLARNAGRLGPDTVLVAWLYRVAQRTAVDVLRRESRRQAREQTAAEIAAMNSNASEWKSVEPWLDEAMETLPAKDRSAILLRFFENKSLREVGQALGTSDDTAQKRVSRGVQRLRTFFARRGVAVSATALAGILSANAVQAAPVGLASKMAVSSLVAASSAAGAGGLWATWMKTLLAVKAKVAAVAVVTATVVTVPLAVRYWAEPKAAASKPAPLVPPGPRVLGPATTVYAQDFAGRPGPEWSRKSTGRTPEGQRPFLGRFVEQPAVLNLDGLPPHKLLRITFDLYLMGSWDGSSKRFGEKIWDLNLLDGRSLMHTTFGNCGFFSDNNEQAFPDSFPCRPHPAWTGSVEHGTLGTTQSWGGPDRTWDVSSVYRFELAFPHTEVAAAFEFKATMRGGKDKGFGLANVQVDTLPDWAAYSEAELAARWKELGDADGERAFRAQWELIAAGDPAVDYLSRHLEEHIDLPQAEIDGLIKEFASAAAEPAKRLQAVLIGQGRTAQPSLVRALDDDAIAAPAQPKLTAIQRTITTYPETATELRLHRARQLLLAIHTPAAQALAAQIPEEHLEPDRAVADLVAAGHAAGVNGDWPKAFECFRDAVAAGSAREADWSCAAVTALAVGDTNASLRFCRGLMNRFAKADDASAAERCAKNCLALPAIPADLLARAVERADFAVAAEPDSRWRQMTRGIAEYRGGNWSKAVGWLREPERSSNLQISSLAWSFGAMARHRLGDALASRQALEEVNRRLKVVVESGELPRTRFNTWDNYARAFAVRAEAERLVLGRETSLPLDPAAVAAGRSRWKPILQLLQSGEELAARKQWAEASEAYARALQQPGFSWDFWELKQTIPAQWLPVAALLAGNETRHLELCRVLLERTNANLAPAVIQGYAGACLARTTRLPPDVKAGALALARQASQQPEAKGSPSVELLRGMIDYREGRYNDTLVTLERAETIRQPVTRARALAFRGMASFRLGRVEEARSALDEAERALVAGPTGETAWWGVGLCEIALNELRALLAAQSQDQATRR